MHKRRRVQHPIDSVHASSKAVTQQHLKEESDINYIVSRARRGIPPTNVRAVGEFRDNYDSPESLTDAYARVERAEEAFSSLPARARDELGNDPRNLLKATPEFFSRHGLITPKEEPEAPPQARQESEGGRPSGKPKASSKAPKAPIPDDDDQE